MTWKCKNLIFLCDELQAAWCPRSSSRVNQNSLSQTMKLTQIVRAHFLVLIWNLHWANYLRSWTYKLSEWCTRRTMSSPEISVPFLSISFLLLLLPSPISVWEPDPCKGKIIEFYKFFKSKNELSGIYTAQYENFSLVIQLQYT